MRKPAFTAAVLAMSAIPAAAEHLYSNGQRQDVLQGYGVERQSGYPPAPDARTVAPRGFHDRDRRRSRTGLDRPCGGHGVPYRTPPQGWPERDM